jgi:hypothetical protein
MIPRTQTVLLDPGALEIETARRLYTMVGMQGVFDATAESLWGKITDPRCRVAAGA